MTRRGPLTIHREATLLRETTPAVPRLAGIAKNLFHAVQSPCSDRPTSCHMSASARQRSHLSDHRTVPNQQPNPKSP